MVEVLNISSYDLKAVGTELFNLVSILKLGPFIETVVSVAGIKPKS